MKETYVALCTIFGAFVLGIAWFLWVQSEWDSAHPKTQVEGER